MNLNDYKKIFFLGIGGIGLSGVARLFIAMGREVSGYDLVRSKITDDLGKLGAKITIGKNIPVNLDADLVVYSQAVPDEEIAKIKCGKLSHGEILGMFLEGKFGIGVTGTNGKSTTTALLSLMLEKAKFDPSALVGSNLAPKNESDKFHGNARFGNGKYFVVESDEYARKMLLNHPQMIVLTNIAEDHLDIYKDLKDIESAFLEYVKYLPQDGILIYNADDHNSVVIGRADHTHKYTFGIEHYADLQAVNLGVVDEGGGVKFDMHLNDGMIGSIEWKIPGKYNVSNALAASLAALKLGVKFSDIKYVLENFAGLWRRFEIVGTMEGKPVISDYAHHPDAVSGTIRAAKEFYPGKRILAVFQPHHRNRTHALFGQFVESLMEADFVVLPEIYDVPGREHGEKISSKDLVDELRKREEGAEYAQDLERAVEIIKAKLKDFDVVLCMGAGDIDTMARKLINGN